MNINFKGTRWFKCDLHLHTTASKCFQDQTVTADQWVQRAIEQGLNCVAVTDHNTGLGVDEIKTAAIGKDLIVFPGVEITCDPSKVHLLILFDVTKTSADIRDFLVRADIRAEDFGKQDAATIKSIFDIAELATTDGALVIPAHIDEYNGLGSVSVGNLKRFFSEFNINAVQVVHKEFLNPSLQTTRNTELKVLLNDYYSNPNPAIDDTVVKEWFTPVRYALENKLAILTFSDNPHEAKNPKHGLSGIGSRYTWIKMDERPTLEGLRQAFLLPTFRVKNDFVSPSIPYQLPDLWFKSITVFDSIIGGSPIPLKVDFNPQLNTIIGGRGSGKSSILRFIRGLFNQTSDISQLQEILQDHNDFYRREEGRPKKGVLKDSTKIEIEFVRNSILHKLIALNIKSSVNQVITIDKYDDLTNSWIRIEDDGYINFFEFEHYSQKQIYEIAQEPNSLRERIDNAISEVAVLHQEKEVIKRSFFEKSTSIRTIQQQISGKGKLQTEIRDLESNIALYVLISDNGVGVKGLIISKNPIALGENLESEKTFKNAEARISYAWALHHQGKPEVAEKIFQDMNKPFSNFKHRVAYGAFLSATSRKPEAKVLLEGLFEEFEHMSGPERKLHRDVNRDARNLYNSLSQK